MKIYTKTGDKGQTSLIGGTRVPKNHIRIEAYGTVDELNSWIGLLRDMIPDKNVISTLIEIQDRLFTIGSILATDPEKSKARGEQGRTMKLPELHPEDISKLEKEIDAIDAVVPPMKSFVLPGGHPIVSHCHIARCICRRAERCTIHLTEEFPVEEIVIQYLNRLSDYLFMLSRKLSQDLGAVEIPWKARV
ncbi:MAG: cob(I)yrinic acid a,c-diamide adenosyltransferase [Bacteroidetes bacterium]|jgi:cob(I)alamin adenosyltransferase|nr:cob(I)yrinic acid a,c-diamide adenosyltransferase [Bacteroidota bacterium]